MAKRNQDTLVRAIGTGHWRATAPENTIHPLGLGRAIWTGLIDKLESFDAAADRMRTTYQPAVLRAEMEKAAAEAKRELGKYEAPLRQVKDAAAAIRAKHKTKDVDLAANAALIGYIWANLPKDSAGVELLWREAIGLGDNLTIAAIESLPFFAKNRLPPQALAEREARVIKAASPADAEELASLEVAIRDLEGVLRFVTEEIDSAVATAPAPPSDGKGDILDDILSGRRNSAGQLIEPTKGSEHANGGAA